MKFYYVLPIVAITALAGCTTKLSQQDRDMIAEANQQSAQALEEAMAARKSTDNAAKRANRMFKESQNK